VFLVLTHDRRRMLLFNVTTNPTAEWTAEQVVAASPWADPPKNLFRDRDGAYGAWFQKRVTGLGMKEVLIAAQSPWQNPFGRLIGSLRRECLDHTIVLGKRYLRRVLRDYFAYDHRWQTQQSLEMDSPEGRVTHLADRGQVIEIASVGRLHHHCERVAA